MFRFLILSLLLPLAAFAQPGPRPIRLVPGATFGTNVQGYVWTIPTNSGSSASIGVSQLTNANHLTNWALLSTNAIATVAASKAQDATNGLGSGAFASALGFTPLTPAVSTNAATKAAQDATNGLGTAAFTASTAYQAALGFTPLTPSVSTNAAVKAAQDATNGIVFPASGITNQNTIPFTNWAALVQTNTEVIGTNFIHSTNQLQVATIANRKSLEVGTNGIVYTGSNIVAGGNINFGGGGSITGPNGASTATFDSGTSETALNAATTVTLKIGGVAKVTLTSGLLDFAANTDIASSGTAVRTFWHRDYQAKNSDTTTTSASLATTALSASVTTTLKVVFHCVLYMTNSVAADGVVIDFNGGSASATAFRCGVEISDSTGYLKSAQVNTLAGTVTASTITGDAKIVCDGYFDPAGSGTFIPRFAVANHTTGTLTCYKGSHIVMQNVP